MSTWVICWIGTTRVRHGAGPTGMTCWRSAAGWSSRTWSLEAVTTNVLLDYLKACREASVAGRPGPNVVTMDGQRLDRYAATTINRRLAAISTVHLRRIALCRGQNPVPQGVRRGGRPLGAVRDVGAHDTATQASLALRLREPAAGGALCFRGREAGSLRTWRDRAIAGLMRGLACALEVLGRDVKGRRHRR